MKIPGCCCMMSCKQMMDYRLRKQSQREMIYSSHRSLPNSQVVLQQMTTMMRDSALKNTDTWKLLVCPYQTHRRLLAVHHKSHTSFTSHYSPRSLKPALLECKVDLADPNNGCCKRVHATLAGIAAVMVTRGRIERYHDASMSSRDMLFTLDCICSSAYA